MGGITKFSVLLLLLLLLLLLFDLVGFMCNLMVSNLLVLLSKRLKVFLTLRKSANFLDTSEILLMSVIFK